MTTPSDNAPQAGSRAADHDGSATDGTQIAAADRRLPGNVMDMNVLDGVRPDAHPTDNQGVTEAPTTERGIRIVFKGQEEVIPEDQAATMIQQYKGINQNYGPYMELAKRLADAGYGPQDGAQLLVEAVQRMQAAGQQPNQPTGEQPGQQNSQPATEQAPNPGADADAEAERLTRELFDSNGLSPTPEVFERFKNMMKYSGQIEGFAGQLQTVVSKVSEMEGRTQRTVEQARAAAVDAAAARVANELGVNDETNFNAFLQHVEQREQVFPGMKQAIFASPRAMEQAIRDWHTMTAGTGTAADNKANALESTIHKDAARAGGDFVPSSGGSGGGEAMDFNTEMMNRM